MKRDDDSKRLRTGDLPPAMAAMAAAATTAPAAAPAAAPAPPAPLSELTEILRSLVPQIRIYPDEKHIHYHKYWTISNAKLFQNEVPKPWQEYISKVVPYVGPIPYPKELLALNAAVMQACPATERGEFMCTENIGPLLNAASRFTENENTIPSRADLLPSPGNPWGHMAAEYSWADSILSYGNKYRHFVNWAKEKAKKAGGKKSRRPKTSRKQRRHTTKATRRPRRRATRRRRR